MTEHQEKKAIIWVISKQELIPFRILTSLICDKDFDPNMNSTNQTRI